MLRGDVTLKSRTDYWETPHEGDSREAVGVSLLAAGQGPPPAFSAPPLEARL